MSEELAKWLRAEVEGDRDDAAHCLRLSRMSAAHRGRLMEKLARARSELAILDEYAAARAVADASRDQPGGVGGGVYGLVRGLERVVRLLAYGYRHRDGYRAREWAP